MPTTFMKQALDVLRDAEVKLCGLIPKALAGHRDEDAGRLMELARLLADARCSRARSGSVDVDTSRSQQPERKHHAKARKKRKASPYPKFFREGDTLLKLGWSRKSRSEYEHRASREAILAVAERVAEVASPNNTETAGRFTVEDLGDVRMAEADEPISGCQVYLCIAWFRKTGLIVQHGRRGYTLPIAPARFSAKVRSAWGELRDR